MIKHISRVRVRVSVILCNLLNGLGNNPTVHFWIPYGLWMSQGCPRVLDRICPSLQRRPSCLKSLKGDACYCSTGR